MSLFQKFKFWQFPKQRMEMFSDAVFAIVITLLVLELKAPHIEDATNTQEVLQALKTVAPTFFSWLVSFFFLCVIWLHHHSIMLMVIQSDYGVMWVNNLLLFFVCLLPFPTAMMGHYPNSPFIVMIWGLTVSVISAMLVWFYYYNAKNFLKETYDQRRVLKNVRLSIFAGPLFYLIAALFSWLSVYVSFVMYALVPFMYLLPLDKEKNR